MRHDAPMPRLLVSLATFVLVTTLGCDADDESMLEDTSSGGEAGDPTVGDDELGWTLIYSGTRTGVFTGENYSVASANELITVAGFVSGDNFFETHLGEVTGVTGEIDASSFALAFDAEDLCEQDDANPVRVTLLETEDNDMFSMSFEGTLECDDGPIEIEGQFRNY